MTDHLKVPQVAICLQFVKEEKPRKSIVSYRRWCTPKKSFCHHPLCDVTKVTETWHHQTQLQGMFSSAVMGFPASIMEYQEPGGNRNLPGSAHLPKALSFSQKEKHRESDGK